VLFQDQRNTGRMDLEATEMALRSALHRAGAAALSQLLQFPAPRGQGARWLALAANKPTTASSAASPC
jgi:hypothetical protein